MTAQPPYEILEHTADVGLVAHGATLGAVFANAAAGMYALMVDPDTVQPHDERTVRIAGADGERLLVAWLLELLFLTDTEGLVFSTFRASVQPEALPGGLWWLDAQARGESFDPARHAQHVVIKAVTHHRLSLKHDDRGYHARLLFDI